MSQGNEHDKPGQDLERYLGAKYAESLNKSDEVAQAALRSEVGECQELLTSSMDMLSSMNKLGLFLRNTLPASQANA